MIEPKRITTYVGAWPQNIGNAFFDLGAEALLRCTFPNSEIIRTGGSSNWMFNNPKKNFRLGKYRSYLNIFKNTKSTENFNSFELGSLIKSDLMVFAGMSVCREFAENNGRTLLEANSRGIPILGLGVGASLYTKSDIKPFVEMCLKMSSITLITRDTSTYELLSNNLPNVHKGIDCGFFLPWYFSPSKLETDNFVISTFDNTDEPEFLSALNTIRTHHDMWGPLSKRYTSSKRCLVSDVPEDYLNLYANAETTYSDRVHACVAALSFGKRAQLYGKTPRSELFAEVEAREISIKPVKLDLEQLEFLRLKQQEILRNSVGSIHVKNL